MDFEAIKKLIGLMEKSDISEIEVEESDFRVKLTKSSPPVGPPLTPMITVPGPLAQMQHAIVQSPQTSLDSPIKEDVETITSPMVGTFYNTPTPGGAAYVEEGDEVSKGQVICIIEAMKVMNEIESSCNGKVMSILVENAQPVEYGEALFLIKPRP